MPVLFTEMWVELEKAHEAMCALQGLFDRERLHATGMMCLEIYAAKERTTWLSPSFGYPVLRIDPFVFRVDDDTRQEAIDCFFPKHWKALEPLNFRCHWGKILSPPDSPTGVEYRHKNFPRLKDFLELREKYDPYGVFLTEYWCKHLGIKWPPLIRSRKPL